MPLGDAAFWIALMQIIGVNIVLSGDNAVVIALAARTLPPAQQKKAIMWGSGAAVVMRIVLTIAAVEMLKFPYLKLVGAGLLMWIGVQLLLPEALARARKLLDDADAKYSVHTLVGKPWEVISEYAKSNHCDQIVMGTRGLGSYTGALLGSVAQGVAQYSPVPVLLVK